MKSRTFTPIILHNTPVDIPKVVKQNYLTKTEPDHIYDEEDESNSSISTDDYEDGQEWSNDDDGEEETEELKETPKKVHVFKRSLTPPLFISTANPKTNLSSTTEILNKMTLDLMMNPQYMSKANPEAFQRKIEQAQRILKHRREIYKTFGECFDALENIVLENKQDDIDLDIQSGFLHFAKMVLLNIQQQQHVGKSGTEPIFSTCNDIHSSFYPDNTP